MCLNAHFSLNSFCVGTALFSRAASSQVFSALMSLTSVFGMGTGGPSPPMAPTFLLRLYAVLYIKQVTLVYTNIFNFLKMVTRTRFELVLPA